MRSSILLALLAVLLFTDSAQAAVQRTIRFRVLNATEQPLTVSQKSTNGVGSWREEPEGARPLRVDDYTEHKSDAGLSGWVEYRIGTTGSTVRVSGDNPLLISKSASCSVTSGAPFTCRYKATGSGSDMNALFVLEPKAAQRRTIDVRDAATRSSMLEALCGIEAMEYASCGAREIEDVSFSVAPTRALGELLVNCAPPGFTFTTSVGTSDTTGMNWSVGVNSETKIKLAGGFKLVLRGYYKHTWAESTTDSKSYKLSVPPGYYGWMERAMTMQDIRADYVLTAGNQTYEIPSVTVSAPAIGNEGGGLAIARAVKIPASSGVCSNRNGGAALPMPTAPRAGKSYTIALAKANLRALAIGTAPLQVEKLERGSESQQWEFAELPGYEGRFQIRNVAQPSRCLTNDTGDEQLTATECKATGAKAQIWTAALDPASSSYRLISDEDGNEPEATADTVGSKVLMRAAPTSERARWEFTATG